ncbi:LPXTG cell wall anchor domain-containing protein [Streptomyces sp. NPDC096324]|uniref:LPXTG cell wall anchor domain-containing protein n=1 Tax=Streptomyces sp. NPDC096324 TaxID=3366085 RepID=UPI003809BE03
MSVPPRSRRASRAAVAVLGAAGLIALAVAPAAFADEAASELVVGGLKPIDGVKPGNTFDVPVTVGNKGTETAEKVWVSYGVTRGLDFAEIPSNCRVQHVRSYDEMPERWIAACEFDQAVAPGAVYTTDKPIRVKVLDRALNEELRARVGDVDPGVDENGYPPVTGTAPALKLVEGQAGGEGSARVVDVPVTAVNTADYQVTGAALKGSVGDTVTMKATFTNAGPAWVQPRPGDRSVSVVITLPAGTSVVKRGQFCQAKGKTYVCGMRSLNEGSGETYTFELKIDKRVAGAKGSVALSTEPRPFDHDKVNDKADITLDVTDGGSSGSTGGSTSGSSGSTGGSTNGSTRGSTGSTSGSGGSTGSSSTNGSAGGSSSTGDAGTATNGGNLAETGSSTLPIMGAAAAALVTGAGTLLVVRRRRSQNLS